MHVALGRIAQRQAEAHARSGQVENNPRPSTSAQTNAGAMNSAISQTVNQRPEVGRLASIQRAANSGPGAAHVAQMKAALGQGSGAVAQMNGSGSKGLFSRYIYGPHSYNVSHKAYSKQPNETDEEATEKVFEGLKKNPAPFSFGESTEEGNEAFVFPFGKIFTKANANKKSITNRTKPGRHLLDPGKVTRTAKGEDIITKGTGTGLFPRLNERFADTLWGSVAYKTRLGLDPEFAKKHYKEVDQVTDLAEEWKY